MVPKQLIVVVEGTAAIGPFWQTIVSDYLDKIIRFYCGNETMGQKPMSTPHVELALVMFNTHGSYSGCLVQRTGWTRDMDVFLQLLSALPFSGGGFSDAAIAEGLGEALMMFSSPNGRNEDAQRHCILVAASNPYPLPTPVYRLQPQNMEQSDNGETQPDNRLSDAEALAKSFAQSAVSLSVICPKNLPKLRELYNAGKSNPRAADAPTENAKNPHFLVLISENFMEARAALTRSGMLSLASNQNPVKMDITPAPPPISSPPTVSVPAANGSSLGRQPIPVGKNIPPATVKVEPTTVTSAAVPTLPYNSSVPRAASQQAVPSLQTSSPISTTSQEIIGNSNENVQEMKPVVNSMPAGSLRPVSVSAAANVNILNNVAPRMLSNVISSGMASSIPPTAQTVISSAAGVTSSSIPAVATGQNPGAPASFTSTAATATVMSQPMNNLQVSVGMGQQLPGNGMTQGNLPPTQIVQQQPGMGMNQKMMPTPGMSQQIQPGGMQPVGMNANNSVANMPMNQQSASTIQPVQSKYIKVWEGNLSGQRQRQPVFITRLEGYRNASASETLAANWPLTMQIVRLISQDHMNNKQYVGKADFLVFRAMDQHGFLGQLQEKKLCAVIQLPSQTLLLSVSDKAFRLIGMLFPGDMVVFKPQIPNPQQQQQQQQLQQQQHMQQLQQQQQQQQQQQGLPMQQQQQQQQMQQQPQQAMQQQQQQQQQQPIMQQLQQQQPMGQPQQQMVGAGMNQAAYMQNGGRSQLMSQGGQVSSQGQQPSMSGGNFMS